MRSASRLEPLGGTLLRYAICVALKRRDRWMSVAEITAALQVMGFSMGTHPNKVVADAIRWEVRRGRVRKERRGRYGYASAPRTTEHRMRAAVAAAQVQLGVAPLGVGSVNSLRGGTDEDPAFDPESLWLTDKDGRRALDLDALDAYETGRGLKTASR